MVLGGWLPSLTAGGVRHMLPEVTCFCFWEGVGVGRAHGRVSGFWIVCFVCSLLYY